MSDHAENVRNYYRRQGAQSEQERIIKLLEAQIYDSTIKGLSWIPDGSELTKADLIELIKGEQK